MLAFFTSISGFIISPIVIVIIESLRSFFFASPYSHCGLFSLALLPVKKEEKRVYWLGHLFCSKHHKELVVFKNKERIPKSINEKERERERDAMHVCIHFTNATCILIPLV